ncbi:hypothetical protein B4O97_15290 [Marispirochaeta aestuarii]|uniref:DinB-like domain-containing protein n=1 Tax=Marispirochaeta aestuarii TaxID=1963862 RepID=A0A1Y1RUP8_9SPIO|nr:DinB family protein [Marispirochaeta aestuarii]ORC32816.1 hypothetical protein B4O97_15290 [Marispirochaeta aestuarii]
MNQKEKEQILRNELEAVLEGGNAHDGWQHKLKNFPPDKINSGLPGLRTPVRTLLTPWTLLVHMRICVKDILDFIQMRDYSPLPFPEGYWPAEEKAPSPEEWNRELEGFALLMAEAVQLVRDLKTDLFSPLPHAPEYSVYRELLLIADHNAYHLGQLGLFEDL